MLFWSKKDTSKVKNILFHWILLNILETQTFQRIAKFIMVDSHEMDFIRYCYFSKHIWDVQYLEVS